MTSALASEGVVLEEMCSDNAADFSQRDTTRILAISAVFFLQHPRPPVSSLHEELRIFQAPWGGSLVHHLHGSRLIPAVGKYLTVWLNLSRTSHQNKR